MAFARAELMRLTKRGEVVVGLFAIVCLVVAMAIVGTIETSDMDISRDTPMLQGENCE
jgi:hypothetical protein